MTLLEIGGFSATTTNKTCTVGSWFAVTVDAIHWFIPHKELGRSYNTVDAPRPSELSRFVAWVSRLQGAVGLLGQPGVEC